MSGEGSIILSCHRQGSTKLDTCSRRFYISYGDRIWARSRETIRWSIFLAMMASSIGSTRATAFASLSRGSGRRRPVRMVFDTRSPSMTASGAESWDSTMRIRRQSSELNTGHLRKPLIIGIGLRAIEAGHTDLSTPKRWSKTSSEEFIANSRSGAFQTMLSTSRGKRTEPCQN